MMSDMKLSEELRWLYAYEDAYGGSGFMTTRLCDKAESLEQRNVELELQVKATELLQDETAAQNESLCEALHQALIHWSAMGVKDEDGLAYNECEKRLNQSPQASLSEVRARQAETSYYLGLLKAVDVNSPDEYESIAKQHANKIRNQEE